MAAVYDNIDLRWVWNGDIDLAAGDIADTSDDYLLSIRQDVHTVSASAFKDWELYEALGAGLDDFIGEPNNRDTASAIHDRLRITLVSLGIVQEEDLSIKLVPVHRHRVLIIVKLNALATPYNSLSDEQGLVISLVFDFLEHGTIFYERTPDLIAG